MDSQRLDLNLDLNQIKDHNGYKEMWKKLGRVEIRMVEKYEECKHCLGDSFIYENPYKKPEGVCTALLHVLDLYIWRVTLGFPSWNGKGRRIFKLHCPDPKGTVWEMKKIED
ncbi:hypothetical protein [Pseudobacteroides cellulosolvens]|uniref:TIGR04076 family protein n=1 Tax=Pseudobacteroides cellulosolvens ATCC 35603 = DSM 2933 TaxID=398512 RepID=A0A0L6JTZ5_9FIRM|nr:hypothetical protein [Pseudobacteroides cellulosolvens]KNY29316.1 hypothetical protein Bccel_4590 [Pseudobacteroides cellulosolvens ATCC 35603 = DSM 2933]